MVLLDADESVVWSAGSAGIYPPQSYYLTQDIFTPPQSYFHDQVIFTPPQSYWTFR